MISKLFSINIFYLLAIIMLIAGSVSYAQEPSPTILPSGGETVLGRATISTSDQVMLVNQVSQHAVTNWQTFNIGKESNVIFDQPNSNSVMLNRVITDNPTSIFGNIQANGKIILVNPSGILFGPGARVDVGSIFASTLRITDSDFMSGNYIFNGGEHAQSIINKGNITALNGVIAFISPIIENKGLLSASYGNIFLAAGKDVIIDFYGDDQASIKIKKSKINAIIKNSGKIASKSGLIVLSSNSVDNIMNGAINNTGIIEANSVIEKDGKIWLSSKNINNTGTLNASGNDVTDGGHVNIQGDFVAMGGLVNVSGASGGSLTIHGDSKLSLTDKRIAKGLTRQGGTVNYRSQRIIENNSSLTDVSGKMQGGLIQVEAHESITSSGGYLANAKNGRGGHVDISAKHIKLYSTKLNATGFSKGGTVRIGGAFQGGKILEDNSAYLPFYNYLYNDLAIKSSETNFINDSTKINVSSGMGEGGTTILWSEKTTTFLGSINATGARGGYVEISSAKDLRHTGLGSVKISPNGNLLIDPKNIIIGTASGASGWNLQGIIGSGYTGGDNVNITLDGSENFGTAVALNDSGNRLAVGGYSDDGFGNGNPSAGAVHLFSFTDNNFSGGTLVGTIGSGYTGGNNVNVALDSNDSFGSGASLNDSGNRLAVGAISDDGFGNGNPSAGAVHLFSFTDNNFSGGTLVGTIGSGYTGGNNVNIALDNGDFFGVSVALNGSGNRLVVGASQDNGFGNGSLDAGAVHLFSFTDNNFSGGTLVGTIGSGYTGGNNVNVALDSSDLFAISVAFNGSGNRLAVGARRDDGFGNGNFDTGAVHLFNFTDNNFSGGTLVGTIGSGYTGGNNVNVALDNLDYFGSGASLNDSGNRLAVGALFDDGLVIGGLDTGAVYLFNFTDNNFSGGTLVGTIGSGYTGGNNVNVALDNLDFFGFGGVALNGSGNRLVVGAAHDDGFGNGNTDTGATYLFTEVLAPNDLTFLANSADDTNLNNTDLQNLLATGVSVTLQANNDITINAPLIVDNPSGNGGTLTLQAGRNVNLNAHINSDNADINIVANELLVNGVLDAHRDSGNSTINMISGASIVTGNGNVNLTLKSGQGLTNKASTNIHLQDINANIIRADNQGASSGSGIELNGVLTAASTSGDSIVLSGDNFINNKGSSALTTAGNARWLVWSENPANDIRGGLIYNFKQYNAQFGINSVLGTGNGLLFTVAPSLTVSLQGKAVKVFDGNNIATVEAPAYIVTGGAIDKDTDLKITSANIDSAFYDNNSVGSRKTVTANLSSVNALGKDGIATVYGYSAPLSTGSFGVILDTKQTSITAGQMSIINAFSGLKCVDRKIYCNSNYYLQLNPSRRPKVLSEYLFEHKYGDDYLTVKEAAKLLKMSELFIRKNAEFSNFKAIKAGKTLFLPRKQFENQKNFIEKARNHQG